MNDSAKIRLSAFEMELVKNTDWIFTKQLIINKVYLLFGDLHNDFRDIISQKKNLFISRWQHKTGKISKGENYKGLPYLILDFPAVFAKEDIFAIRTLFWWGNFFSISLHVSGKFYRHMKKSEEVFSVLKENHFSVCINENQWQHDFNVDNFKNINNLSKREMNKIFLKPFFKTAKKIELTEWNKAEFLLIENFKKLIDFIALSFPGDGKAL